MIAGDLPLIPEAPEELAAEQPESAELFDPAGLSPADKRALLNALLFTAGEVLPAGRLAEFLGLDETGLELLVAEGAVELQPLGLDILRAAGGYRMVTGGHWDAYLARFHRQVRRARLSKSALEILAVIAYEQPVSRARIDELRQVNSESSVRALLDKRLITVAGRAETPGRPFLYRTTPKFLEAFGLSGLEDLPPRPASLDLAPSEENGTEREEATHGLDDLPGFDSDMLED